MTALGESGVAAQLAAGRSPYAVKLPVFEGPLDLLLHLIRLNEVEITDIPIARVAEQYLAYLELMRELDLDIAGGTDAVAAGCCDARTGQHGKGETAPGEGRTERSAHSLASFCLKWPFCPALGRNIT